MGDVPGAVKMIWTCRNRWNQAAPYAEQAMPGERLASSIK